MEITGRASRASDDSPKESRSVVGLILQLVAENTRQKSGSRIIVGSCKTAEADLRRVTENPHHHVHTVRARVRARVQRLCDDERGIRRGKEIWGEIPVGPHGGSRARLPEPAEDRRRLCGPGGAGGAGGDGSHPQRNVKQ